MNRMKCQTLYSHESESDPSVLDVPDTESYLNGSMAAKLMGSLTTDKRGLRSSSSTNMIARRLHLLSSPNPIHENLRKQKNRKMNE